MKIIFILFLSLAACSNNRGAGHRNSIDSSLQLNQKEIDNLLSLSFQDLATCYPPRTPNPIEIIDSLQPTSAINTIRLIPNFIKPPTPPTHVVSSTPFFKNLSALNTSQSSINDRNVNASPVIDVDATAPFSRASSQSGPSLSNCFPSSPSLPTPLPAIALVPTPMIAPSSLATEKPVASRKRATKATLARLQPPKKVPKPNETAVIPTVAARSNETLERPIPQFNLAENDEIVEARLNYALELARIVLDPSFASTSQKDAYFKNIKDSLGFVYDSAARYFDVRNFDLLSSIIYFIDESIDRSSCESILNSEIAQKTNYKKTFIDPNLSFGKNEENLNNALRESLNFSFFLLNFATCFPLPRAFLSTLLGGIHVFREREILCHQYRNARGDILQTALEALKKLDPMKAGEYIQSIEKFKFSDISETLAVNYAARQKDLQDILKILQEVTKSDAGFYLAIQIIKDTQVHEGSLDILNESASLIRSQRQNLLKEDFACSSRLIAFKRLLESRNLLRSKAIYAAQVYYSSKLPSSMTLGRLSDPAVGIERWKLKISTFETIFEFMKYLPMLSKEEWDAEDYFLLTEASEAVGKMRSMYTKGSINDEALAKFQDRIDSMLLISDVLNQ